VFQVIKAFEDDTHAFETDKIGVMRKTSIFRTNPLLAMMADGTSEEEGGGGGAMLDADTGQNNTDDDEDCLVL
jgi:hypothetical protein